MVSNTKMMENKLKPINIDMEQVKKRVQRKCNIDEQYRR